MNVFWSVGSTFQDKDGRLNHHMNLVLQLLWSERCVPYQKDTIQHYLYATNAEEKDWAKRQLSFIPEEYILLNKNGAVAAFQEAFDRDDLQKDDILFDCFCPALLQWQNAGGGAVQVIRDASGNNSCVSGTFVQLTYEGLTHIPQAQKHIYERLHL